MSAPGDRSVQYSFAVLRAVPHPYTGEGVDVGVVVHSRPADYLGVRVVSDPAELGRMVGDVDVELLARYLDSCAAIAAGDEGAEPIALLSAPERFHWLTSPRSDVLQCVVGRGARLAAWGVGIVLVGVWISRSVLGKLVYGISDLDPWTVALGCTVLALVAVAASALPARRAASRAPMVALRTE